MSDTKEHSMGGPAGGGTAFPGDISECITLRREFVGGDFGCFFEMSCCK